MGYQYNFKVHKKSPGRSRPTRTQLNGMSCSEFKTRLKRLGYKIPRNFFKLGSVAKRGGRRYRFRWWSEDFMCDVSCSWLDFDRWANSTEKKIPIDQALRECTKLGAFYVGDKVYECKVKQ